MSQLTQASMNQSIVRLTNNLVPERCSNPGSLCFGAQTGSVSCYCHAASVGKPVLGPPGTLPPPPPPCSFQSALAPPPPPQPSHFPGLVRRLLPQALESIAPRLERTEVFLIKVLFLSGFGAVQGKVIPFSGCPVPGGGNDGRNEQMINAEHSSVC